MYFHMESGSVFHLFFNDREIDQYGNEGLMVWAGIELHGCISLHVFRMCTVGSVTYKYVELGHYDHIICGTIYIIWSTHFWKVKILVGCTGQIDLGQYTWPLYSIYGTLRMSTAVCNLRLSTIQFLKTALLNEWDVYFYINF